MRIEDAERQPVSNYDVGSWRDLVIDPDPVWSVAAAESAAVKGRDGRTPNADTFHPACIYIPGIFYCHLSIRGMQTSCMLVI